MTMQPKSASLCDGIFICKAMALGNGATKDLVHKGKIKCFGFYATIGLPCQRRLRHLFPRFEIIHAHEPLLAL